MASDTSLVFNLVAKDKASAVIGQMGDKITTAATGIAAGIAGALGAGIAESMNTELITDKLAAQLGAGPEMAEEFGGIAGRLYTQGMGSSMEEAAGALKAVWQNGILDEDAATAEIEAITQKAMALGQTFDQDVGQVAVAVGQMIKTGMAASAEEAMDILTRGFQEGADKSGDLLDTMNEYSTQWRRVGLDGKTAIGLLSQGLKAGARDADQVADAIGQFGERALAGGKPIDEAFKSIGLSSDTMAKMLGAGGDQAERALQMTMDALRGTSSEQVKLNAAAALFGDPGNVMGASLFALNPAAAAASAGMNNAAGATDRLSKTISDSPAAALEKFKRESMAKLGEIGGQFVQFAMTHQQYFEPIALTLGGIAAAVLVVKGAMMAWAAAQAIWTGVTVTATAVQWLWNAAMMANPIGLIILAVIALVAGIVLLWQHSETFRAIVSGSFEFVWGVIKAVWNWVKDNWRLLLTILTGPIGLAVGLITRYWGEIKGGAVAVFDWICGVPGMIGSAFGGLFDILTAPFRRAFNAVAGYWNRSVGGMHFTAPDWVPGFGGKGFSMPRIPTLAEGGIIPATPGGRLAIIGEGGQDEAVIPLDRLAGAGGGTVHLTIELSGPDEVKRLIRKIVRTDGRGSVQTAFGTG